jgi:hypothetical protein
LIVVGSLEDCPDRLGEVCQVERQFGMIVRGRGDRGSGDRDGVAPDSVVTCLLEQQSQTGGIGACEHGVTRLAAHRPLPIHGVHDADPAPTPPTGALVTTCGSAGRV